MKIGISGGTGLEKLIARVLKDYPLLITAGKYDLRKEKFEPIENVEFFPEFLNHNYIEEFGRNCDIYIDVSPSNKIKYLVSDFAQYFNKICYILFYNDGWQFLKLSGKNSHLSYYKEFTISKPFALLPEIDRELLISILEKEDFTTQENWVYDLSKKEKKILELSKKENNFDFMKGQFADIASVSCSDNSVAISQMNNTLINLDFYKENLTRLMKP
ncbi:MAG: hypothetical protein QXF12_08195, partial [Candidatus Aenigmatarchaeota archaeon]